MKFSQSNADLFVPDAIEPETALGRTTHLGIGAHQDDLEFMALHGILESYNHADRWFGGVTCTDGGGSARSGRYADYSDGQMKEVRVEEQKAAARTGQYAFMAQLGHPSSHARDEAKRSVLVDDLVTVLKSGCPEFVYTHNPFDKHATHIGVFLATLAAIRHLPAKQRPRGLFGCEVWRGLDWLPDELKVVQDVSAHPDLAAALSGTFESQIAGGKRYDLAVDGRRLANATFHKSHATDTATRVSYAVDLTPLITENGPSIGKFTRDILDVFNQSILRGLGLPG